MRIILPADLHLTCRTVGEAATDPTSEALAGSLTGDR